MWLWEGKQNNLTSSHKESDTTGSIFLYLKFENTGNINSPTERKRSLFCHLLWPRCISFATHLAHTTELIQQLIIPVSQGKKPSGAFLADEIRVQAAVKLDVPPNTGLHHSFLCACCGDEGKQHVQEEHTCYRQPLLLNLTACRTQITWVSFNLLISLQKRGTE